jgi:hypothetical protein
LKSREISSFPGKRQAKPEEKKPLKGLIDQEIVPGSGSDFADQVLETRPAHEKVRRILVFVDLSDGGCAGMEMALS